ncbi:hypothetical protein PR048_009460 [Dryococelus australis]|uniref:HTH psq-type domain-containing protein n=1 Tax=Dryococelus australis TaxID=614101 RepID=A0ABQ9HZY0_9NEOP|nr:hypothetical protein PR048_009460 [Dryococelus australis]
MHEAVAFVDEGLSLHKAANDTGVKYATLFRIRMCRHHDCRKIFTKEQDDDSVNCMLNVSK